MSRLWNRLKHNFGLKITALFFALLLWSFVISETDPERNRTYREIPIEIVGMSELDREDLAIKGDVSSIFHSADVALRLKISEIDGFNPENMGVMADLSGISEPGTYTIPLTAHSPRGSIDKIIPESITVEVEEKDTIQLPIRAEKTGMLPEGLYSLDPIVTPEYVEVSGASSDVAAIHSAVIYLDESTVTESFSGKLPVELLNENGEIINYRRFDLSQPTAEIYMEVLPVKRVPIDVSTAIKDASSVARGYRVTSVTASPAEIEVAGDAKVLSGLNGLSLMPVGVRDVKETFTVTTSVVLPGQVVSAGTTEVTLTINVEKAE